LNGCFFCITVYNRVYKELIGQGHMPRPDAAFVRRLPVSDYTISVQERTIVGKKVNKLRRQGIVPLTVYGPDTPPANLQADYRQLEMMLRKAGGTHLIELDTGSMIYNVLAREVQRDVIRREILHVDFFAINENARVTVEVPINMINESAAVVSRKGVLLTGPNSLSVEMPANNMIDQIDIDLSQLPEVGDSLYVRDLSLGESARILNDPEEMIARIAQTSAARREEVLEGMAAAEGSVGDVELVGQDDDDDE